MQPETSEPQSFEEMLRELARRLRAGRALNVDEYFDLLAWARVILPVRDGGRHWNRSVGTEKDGFRYAMLYTSSVFAGRDFPSEVQLLTVSGREVLRRLANGTGLIVDYGTDSEVTINPDVVTELSEKFRFKPVKVEATIGWLSELNSKLRSGGMAREVRAAAAMEAWESLNGFRVLSGSRRYRWIQLYFHAIADVLPDEQRTRCEERWHEEYSRDPYLCHLASADLRTRLNGLHANLMFSDRRALPHELSSYELEELLVHVRHECSYRKLDIEIPQDPMWPRLPEGQRAFAEYSGPIGQLYKLGESEHMEQLVANGALRIFPASRYQDASLTPAQVDDELRRIVFLDPRRTRLEHVDKTGERRLLTPAGPILMTQESRTNYYVWCLSTGFDPRLFDDFAADCCVIIHDAHTFIDRLFAAVERVLPGWVGAESLVEYFDPVRSENRVLSTFHKDFRYAYQREFRIVWDPPSPRLEVELDSIDVCLGALHDVASIIRL